MSKNTRALSKATSQPPTAETKPMSPAEEYFGVRVPEGWGEVAEKTVSQDGDMHLDKDSGIFVAVTPAVVGKPWCWFNLLIRKKSP